MNKIVCLFNPDFAIDFGIQRKIALFYRLKNCLRTLQVCSHFFSAIKFSTFASRFSNSIAKSGFKNNKIFLKIYKSRFFSICIVFYLFLNIVTPKFYANVKNSILFKYMLFSSFSIDIVNNLYEALKFNTISSEKICNLKKKQNSLFDGVTAEVFSWNCYISQQFHKFFERFLKQSDKIKKNIKFNYFMNNSGDKKRFFVLYKTFSIFINMCINKKTIGKTKGIPAFKEESWNFLFIRKMKNKLNCQWSDKWN